jgi:hypothetical protein
MEKTLHRSKSDFSHENLVCEERNHYFKIGKVSLISCHSSQIKSHTATSNSLFHGLVIHPSIA